MIVVGGWPGRNVVGLNGRFGVRPADFSVGGSFDNPFLDDVDPGDDDTEFAGVVTALPGSGAVVFDDLGGFSHTGAADGAYSTVFDLYTWAQGGPITAHTPPETITTTFGSTSTASGVTVTAAASLIAGAASGEVGATAAGATLIAAVALVSGAAAGEVAATAVGVALTAAAALLPGTAEGAEAGTATGTTIVAAAVMLPGTASGQMAASAAGPTLTAAASLVAGTASGSSAGSGTIDPAAFWGHLLSNGQSAGDNIVAIRTALENRPTVGDIAGAVWGKVLP